MTVKDFLGDPVAIPEGRLLCGQFPFVVMTSNAEREFPAPFLRRCVRAEPRAAEQETPWRDHRVSASALRGHDQSAGGVEGLIDEFDRKRAANEDVSTDQLLNAVFLSVALRDAERSFGKDEAVTVRENLLKPLSGPQA